MQITQNLLLLRNANGTDVIDISSIIRIEASSNYSKIFFASGKVLVSSKVLKWFEGILSHHGFARIHRSHLINSSWIQTYQFNNNVSVILQNHEQLFIAKRKKKQMLQNFVN